MQLASGSYTGTGSSNPISGLGFTPTFVIVWRTTAGSCTPRYKTTPMAATTAAGDFVSAWTTDAITSIDSDGFTVGTSVDTNASGSSYAWVAMRGGSVTADLAVGSYTGNGSDNRNITGVGFQPDMVWVQKDSNSIIVWTTSKGGDNSYRCRGGGSWQADRIQGVHSDGFQVGTNADVNTSSTTYYYVCWKTRIGQIAEGQYTGNGADNRNITQGDAFQPDTVWVLFVNDFGAPEIAWRPPAAVGDQSLRSGQTGWIANIIQAINSDGFQLGTDIRVNSNVFWTTGNLYWYWSFKNGGSDTPPPAFDPANQPWNAVLPVMSSARWI